MPASPRRPGTRGTPGTRHPRHSWLPGCVPPPLRWASSSASACAASAGKRAPSRHCANNKELGTGLGNSLRRQPRPRRDLPRSSASTHATREVCDIDLQRVGPVATAVMRVDLQRPDDFGNGPGGPVVDHTPTRRMALDAPPFFEDKSQLRCA